MLLEKLVFGMASGFRQLEKDSVCGFFVLEVCVNVASS